MSAHFYCCFSILLLFFSFGCEDKFDYDVKTIEFGDLQSGESVHIVTNKSSELAYYNVVINGMEFIHSLDDLISRIESGKGKTRQENVWMYTSANSYHFVPLTEKKWYHDPVVFFNSIGFGYCDDVSIINSIIWQGMGYNSRIWNINLGTHIVSEVAENGMDWQLFDSDLGLYFIKNDKILSVDDLMKPSAVNNEIVSINNDVNAYRKTYIDQQMLLWESFRYNYKSSNNYVETIELEDFKRDSLYNYTFSLPPGGQLFIGRQVGEALITSKVEGQNWLVPDYYNLIVKIGGITNYSYSIPLLLQRISGEGVLRIDGLEYILPQDSGALINMISTWETSIRVVELRYVKNLELTYLLNPLLFNERNEIKVQDDER